MCVVPPDVYRDGFFYFCCAPEDALSVADASQLQCFQLQICTEVNREEFPANVVPGTVGTIRVDVTGFPQPNTSLSQPTDTRNVVRNDSITDTFTNFIYVISFVVPHEPEQRELDFQVDFTTPQGCLPVVVTGHANVIQNADTLLEELGVCPPGPEPTTPTPSSPTPPVECECFNHLVGGIAAAVGLGVILIFVFVALCITYCVCKGKGRSLHGSETSSGSYTAGSYTPGPYEVTRVAPSEEPPPFYSTIPAVGLQNGQSQGEATTSRPSLLRLRSSERTPEETPATSATLLYPQQTPQSQPQYSFRHGLPADGSAIPNLQGLPAGTIV